MYNNNYQVDLQPNQYGHRTNHQNKSLYPHLERLCKDFGLQLWEETGNGDSALSLVVSVEQPIKHLTPCVASLRELEGYVAEHMTDILHEYLCEGADVV